MGVVLIIISVDSDDEEATVRDALAEAGLSFTIQRGRVYVGGGGRSGPATHAGTSGDNGQGGCAGGGRGGYTTGSGGTG